MEGQKNAGGIIVDHYAGLGLGELSHQLFQVDLPGAAFSFF